AYRFNRRFRLAEMLPRLARAMTLCKPWPEQKLRAVDNFHG
ncbi:MAG: IS1595 family transposase, partial [Rhodanobacteraceae bacterium]